MDELAVAQDRERRAGDRSSVSGVEGRGILGIPGAIGRQEPIQGKPQLGDPLPRFFCSSRRARYSSTSTQTGFSLIRF